MLKRKLSTLILATTIANMTAAPINVFAETLSKNNTVQTNELSEKNETKKLLLANSVYMEVNYYKVIMKFIKWIILILNL